MLLVVYAALTYLVSLGITLAAPLAQPRHAGAGELMRFTEFTRYDLVLLAAGPRRHRGAVPRRPPLIGLAIGVVWAVIRVLPRAGADAARHLRLRKS